MPESELTKNTISGVNWSFIRSLGDNFFKFFIEIILARLLIPEDFGIFGIALIFIGFGNIFSSLGVGAAVIQKKDLSVSNIKVGLTISILSGLFIYILIWVTSPLISGFFNEPEVEIVLRVLGIIFLLQGAASISRGLLKRNFKFKILTIIELGSFLFGYGLVAVPLALLNYGVWSLVFGVIFRNLFLTIALLVKSKVPFNFIKLRGGEGKKMLFFGGGISGIQLFNYAATRIDYIIIGRYLTSSQLGLYTKAYTLMRIPANLFSNVLGNVLFSTFSDVQDNIKRMRKGYLMSVQMINLLGFPLLSGMSICSDYLIVGLYGNQWSEAIVPFSILCIAAVFQLTTRVSGSVIQALGYVYKEMYAQFMYAGVLGFGIWMTIDFGLIGVSYAVVFGAAVYFLLMTHLALKYLCVDWLTFLKSIKGGIVLSLPVLINNIVCIKLIELFFPNLPTELKLLLLVLTSAISIILGFIFISERIKGDGPKWLLYNYSNFLPLKLDVLLKEMLR